MFDSIKKYIKPHDTYSIPHSPRDGSLLSCDCARRLLVYDNHKFLFVLLYLLRESEAGQHILHIDRHWDTRRTELGRLRNISDIASIGECFRYVDLALQEGDFIIPALTLGLIRRLTFHVPDSLENQDRNIAACRAAGADKASILCKLDGNLPFETSETILDIDLDYFVSQEGTFSVAPEVLAGLLRYEWRGIGLALSPNHCGGIGAPLNFLILALKLAGIDPRQCFPPLFDRTSPIGKDC